MSTKDWCSQHGIATVHHDTVRFILNKLTLEELATQYNVATAQWDPRGTNGYDKLRSLYGAKDDEAPPPMRDDDLEIFGQEIGRRLPASDKRRPTQ